MRIKELFTVPDGKKVTEKMMYKVLFSSICSILLCMACLVGTTWAWFTVSIENTGNEIQIATVTAKVTITNTTSNQEEVLTPDNGSYELATGTYTVCIGLDSDATVQASPVYVHMEITYKDEAQDHYVVFEGTSEAISKEEKTLQIRIDDSIGDSIDDNDVAIVRFAVSWVKPASDNLLDEGDDLVIGESSTELTETTEADDLAEDEETTESAETESSEIESEEIATSSEEESEETTESSSIESEETTTSSEAESEGTTVSSTESATTSEGAAADSAETTEAVTTETTVSSAETTS